MAKARSLTAALTSLAVMLAFAAAPVAARAEVAPPSQACDRDSAVVALKVGGPAVKTAATHALLGTDADVCAFLSSDWDRSNTADRRTAVNQMLTSGGPSIRNAARAALNSSDPAAIDTFLTGGWRTAWQNDRRLRVNQMMAAGGSQLKAAAQKALDSTDPSALDTFLNSGWQHPYEVDQRLRVNQIMASAGPEVKAAAQTALNAGDVDSLTRFLDTDWSVAATRDAETTQIQQLVQTAVAAGQTAQQESDAAVEESQRAQAAAAAAKQAAADAKAAAAAAHDDAQAAADAAKRAATAAQNAAAAAQQAVSAAGAANAAARVAAGAAAKAAAAAAKTSQSASWAYNAASSAALDAGAAASARAAAQSARDMAAQAKTAADAAGHAGDAARNAGAAATGAQAAANDAALAAQWALDAGNYANLSIDEAKKARQAAATAAANANRANRAAAAAIGFAAAAANAAFQSRDAANRAAADALAAAAAADDAATHAGQAADAALKATDHANAAVVAATAAVAAATQAQGVYDQARQAEADQLAVIFEQNDDQAKAAAVAFAQQLTQATWDAAQAAKRSAVTNQLITEANDPATPRAKAVADARQVALTLSGADRAWTRAAAQLALGGDDDAVLQFLRHGLAVAAGQDDRATLDGLMVTGTTGFVAAAAAAMAGSDADVAAFLASQYYPGRDNDDRIAVNQVIATARDAGNAVVVQRGQQALDSGSDQAMRAFLTQGQYDAAAVDERVKVNQVLADPNSGPEVRAAAQVALDGPAAFLHQFLQVGRYQAAQRDLEAAAHRQTVLALLLQANEAASTAVQNASRAQEAAAVARGAATDAASYAQQAANAAAQAVGYAQQAQQSAQQASDSANQAAASASTAVAAAKSADTAARNAARSAVWAAASARHAAADANEAYSAAKRARDTAIAAGKDAQAAVDAANTAFDVFRQKYNDEQMTWAFQQADANCNAPLVDRQACLDNLILIIKDPVLAAYINGGACAVLYQPGVFYDNCINDVLSPTFGDDQALTIANGILTFAAGLYTFLGSVLAGIAVAEFCFGICSAFLEAATPALMPEMIGLPGLGLDALAGGVTTVRIAALIEETTVANEADVAELARLIEQLTATCGVPNSFAPTTPVLLADGTSKPIQDIQVGDRVLSSDPRTGVIEPEAVTRTIVGSGQKPLVEVAVGSGTVTATANHPFWAPDLARWIPAGNLRAGQLLLTGAGTRVQVSAVRQYQAPATVYNLSVADLHTYYVLAGTTPVLVHNADCEHVALGIRYPSSGIGSDALADLLRSNEGIDIRTFNGDPWGDPDPAANNGLPLWIRMVSDAINNPSVKIDVSLDGLAGDTAYLKLRGAVRIGKTMSPEDAKNSNGTDWELAKLMRLVQLKQDPDEDLAGAGRSLDSIRFFLNGKDVTNELKAQLPTTPEGWKEFRGD